MLCLYSLSELFLLAQLSQQLFSYSRSIVPLSLRSLEHRLELIIRYDQLLINVQQLFVLPLQLFLLFLLILPARDQLSLKLCKFQLRKLNFLLESFHLLHMMIIHGVLPRNGHTGA